MVKASRRKSSSSTSTATKTQTSNLETSPRPEPKIIQRRNSSFASTSSPWFRRNSFLSSSMIQNEEISIYESLSSNYYTSPFGNSSSSITSTTNRISSYNIISLKESQGFIFNQDLFATPYQQLRSLANERRSSSSHNSINSNKSKRKNSNVNSSSNCERRRHTSYHPSRPLLGHALNHSNKSNDHAIEDDEDEDEEMHDANEELITIPNPHLINEIMEEDDDDDNDNDNDDTHTQDDMDEGIHEDDDDDIDDDDDDDDLEDEYHEMNGYGGDLSNRRYKVQVTDIIIDEKDSDIFPT